MEFQFRGAYSTIRLLVEVLVWRSGEGRGGDPVEDYASKAGGSPGVSEILERPQRER